MELLDKVKKVLDQKRNKYNEQEDLFYDIAKLWTNYLGDTLNDNIGEYDVAVMMALFKIARIKHFASVEDSFIDAIGYLLLAYEKWNTPDDTEAKLIKFIRTVMQNQLAEGEPVVGASKRDIYRALHADVASIEALLEKLTTEGTLDEVVPDPSEQLGRGRKRSNSYVLVKDAE